MSLRQNRSVPNPYGYHPSRAVYEPTAAEIEARAAQVRKAWSPAEHLARSGWAQSEPVELSPTQLFVDKGEMFGVAQE